MTTTLAPFIGDAAEHAASLAGIFQFKGNSLKALHIRKADKALIALEAFFTPKLSAEANTWRRGVDAERVLDGRLVSITMMQEGIDSLRERLENEERIMLRWNALPDSERQRIIGHAKRAKQYFEAKTFYAESHILHRYERYQALRGLVAYADNAQFLCEAIHHFENRAKYEDNKIRLESRRESALVRLRSVKRGFYLAIAFCALIVTVPLCAPFAWSLWRRKTEVENQIANLDETLRREDKRIQAADEGVIAAQEIREVLGPVPLDQVKATLTEVSELRREFQSSSSSQSATATLLSFLDLFSERLTQLFGDAPKGTLEHFRWLATEVDHIVGVERERVRLGHEISQAEEKLRRFLRGHSVDMVRQSLVSVRRVTSDTLPFPAAEWVKRDFAAIAMRMPPLLEGVRRALWHVSHGQSIDEVVWKRLGVALASESNLLSACALELRLGAVFESSIPEGSGEPSLPLAVV